ncbi:MAG: MATE family efflux transporter [Nitratireductor sp.]
MATSVKTKPDMSQAKFTKGSTMQHVITMTATGAVGMIAVFMVDLANLFYISLLGEKALAAAIGYASTIMFFATSVCIGFTIAATAITAKALGKGDIELAKKEASVSLVFVFIATSIISLLMMLNIKPLLSVIGAKGETLQIAYEYMLIAVPSIPLMGLAMCMAGLLRAKGDAKRAMYIPLIAAIFGAMLDPILIFYYDLGVNGAAISMIFARIIFVIVGLHGVAVIHKLLSVPTWQDIKRVFVPFMVIGFPSLLTQVSTPFGNAYVTSAIADFGDDAVAGWAVIGRLIPLAFAATFSLSGAVGPILAQNYGAGLVDRITQAMKDSLLFIIIYMGAMWALLAIGHDLIIQIFGATGDGALLIEIFCFYVAGLFGFTAILFVANAAFNNLGNPFLSTAFNWGRATIGIIPFVWVGAQWGASGVLIGWALGGTLFGLAAIIVCFRTLKKLPERAENEGIIVHHTPAISHSPFSSGKSAGM